jgi:alpha-L-fucosidase
MQHEHAPAPYGPVPSERQLAWHELEFYGFVHFTVNTFTGLEWGYGDEDPSIFDPSGFDADRIVSAAKEGGMRGLVLTCKHHDGFCLWPSRYTDHSVKSSRWRGGQGNVVAELSRACASAGIGFGAYLSPWDRNHADYGTEKYIIYYRNQLRELLSSFGPMFEVWFDGANGGDGYYGGAREKRSIDARTYYGWEQTWQIVRDLQPQACMFSDVGPDIRWVGNEKGIAGEPCLHTIDASSFAPGDADRELLNHGERYVEGSDRFAWLPAECDVSIRPGWFYHAEEDERVRTPENLVELYYQSVGRGASLHLNLPPDRRGLIHETDAASLAAFRRRRDATFSNDLAKGATVTSRSHRGNLAAFSAENLLDPAPDTYWSTDDEVHEAEAIVDLVVERTFNIVDLREYLPLGQRVDRFTVEVEEAGRWRIFAEGSAIGRRRIASGSRCTAKRIRLRCSGPVAPAISSLAVFYDAGR